ncbi:MAG: alpha/beta hydrolase [Bacteroidetes bacterium]|nr:alpha/beta hydrolase [Bacteroidota bacterium]
MRTFILFFALAVAGSSCLRLDSMLYNTTDKLERYERDNYTGEQDFILDETYKIQDSMIHEFTLASQVPGESSPTTIYAVYLGDINRISIDTVILYCHGNKWHMDFYWQRAKLLAHTGSKHRYGVLMPDYRGFGRSEGTPTEDGLYADVDAAMNWLKTNGLTNARLVVYGFSMGSAPAVELSAHPRSMRPSKIILEAPFASAAVMGEDGSQLAMPGSYFTNLKIDNAEEIKLCNQPLLWIHGTGDNFLNYTTHGQVVFDNSKGNPKYSYLVSGADHGNVPVVAGFSTYSTRLLEFITE